MQAMIEATLMGEELSVIDDTLILACAEAERKSIEGDKKHHEDFHSEAPKEPLVLAKLSSLTMSFKNIRVVENLLTLDNLQTLRLDNNAIDRIENIEHLVNLEWLDLSFNNITMIEGLATLTKLRDLTLFNNSIPTVEGLETLVNLEVLSLGNNKLASLDGLMYLRQFKDLKVVNLDGNPVASEPDYRSTMLAFMNNLQYLDYSRVELSERRNAQEIHQHLLLDLEEQAQNEALTQQRDEENAERAAKLGGAGLVQIDTLLDIMLGDDVDGKRLRILPGVDDLTNQFREKTRSMMDECEEVGFEENEVLRAEFKLLQAGLAEIVELANAKALKLVQEFDKFHKHTLRDAHTREDGDVFAAVEALRRVAAGLKDKVITVEVTLMEDVNHVVNEFESRYNELSTKRRDNFDAFFRGVEDAANAHRDSLAHIVANLADRVKEDEAGAGLEMDAVELLQEKDVVLALVQSSNDYHIGSLLAIEDKVRVNEKARMAEAVDGTRAAHKVRNRERIVELAALDTHIRGLLDEVEMEEKAAEEDDEDELAHVRAPSGGRA